jgi:hypothetical protein
MSSRQCPDCGGELALARRSVAALAKSLNEPTAFVRFALEQLRDQGIAFRRGGRWSIARYSRAGAA